MSLSVAMFQICIIMSQFLYLSQKNTKVYPCMYCKTLCKNFEMLSNVDKTGRVGLFCSICCITSHKVKQAGIPGEIHCDITYNNILF